MTTDPRAWRVFVENGWGSAIAEAALAIAGVPFERVPAEMSGARDALRAVNPLGQLPTVVRPDGSVLTESAAIVLRLGDLAPAAGLVPPADAPERAAFLRRLVWFVAAMYPTFTYGDDPSRWGCGDELRKATDEHRVRLWRELEAEVRGPWVLGARFSALDIYVAVMTNWRPNPPWFAAHTPRLHAIAQAVARRPELARVWQDNFPS